MNLPDIIAVINGLCNMHGRNEKCNQKFSGQTERKDPLRDQAMKEGNEVKQSCPPARHEDIPILYGGVTYSSRRCEPRH